MTVCSRGFGQRLKSCGSFGVSTSGWVWLTPTLENQWLDADKILPAAFLSDTHQDSAPAPKLPIFLWNPGLIRRASDRWNENSVACPLPSQPLFEPNKGKEGFFGGIWNICDTFNFVAYCLKRLWSWRRGENRELESEFVNSCLSLLPSGRQGQTTPVKTVGGTKT